MMGQCRADRKQSGREREGMGSGKVHELGFELGTPIAQVYRCRLRLKLCCLKEDDRHARSMATQRSASFPFSGNPSEVELALRHGNLRFRERMHGEQDW